MTSRRINTHTHTHTYTYIYTHTDTQTHGYTDTQTQLHDNLDDGGVTLRDIVVTTSPGEKRVFIPGRSRILLTNSGVEFGAPDWRAKVWSCWAAQLPWLKLWVDPGHHYEAVDEDTGDVLACVYYSAQLGKAEISAWRDFAAGESEPIV